MRTFLGLQKRIKITRLVNYQSANWWLRTNLTCCQYRFYSINPSNHMVWLVFLFSKILSILFCRCLHLQSKIFYQYLNILLTHTYVCLRLLVNLGNAFAALVLYSAFCSLFCSMLRFSIFLQHFVYFTLFFAVFVVVSCVVTVREKIHATVNSVMRSIIANWVYQALAIHYRFGFV